MRCGPARVSVLCCRSDGFQGGGQLFALHCVKIALCKHSRMYATGEMSKEDFDRRVASIKGLLAHTQSASLRGRLNLIYRDTMQKYGRQTGPETDIWKGTYEEKKLARSVRKAA